MQVHSRKARRFKGGMNLPGLLLTILLLPALLLGTAGVAAAGGTWSAATSSNIPATTSYDLYDVAYDGNGKWVLVGKSGTWATSPDGQNWTLGTTGLNGAFYSVAYNSNSSTWIMSSANGKIWTSTDGAASWTATTVFGNVGVNKVEHGPGDTYVAVAATGGTPAGNLAYYDGSAWHLMSVGTVTLQSVIYGGGQWVAIGRAGNIFTSPDGTAWTARTSGVGSLNLWTVKYGNGLYVVVGDSGVILTSTDGVTWTRQASGMTTAILYGAAYGNQWVATGASGIIYSSPDGITWSSETSGVSTNLFAATYGDNLWVAVGGSGAIRTKPGDSNPPVTTISGVPGTATNANVTLTLSATDDVTGVANTYYKLDGGAQTAGTTVTVSTEGNHTLQYWSVDNAGNTEAPNSASFTIDKTPPTLSGAATSTPNGAGWYNSNVTIHWTATDALSGIATQPADSTISTEGTTGSASATVQDMAGNSASATVSGIKLDKTAPTTTAAGIPANSAHASNGSVTVTLSATDSLSGVANTYYQLDSGTQTAGTSVTVSAEGAHTLKYWSTDNAGTTETQHTDTIWIDKTAPTIGHTLTPAPNANGWNNADVSVTFNCADPGGSGVASCTSAQSVTAETAGQTVSGTVTDAAGNAATDSVTVKLDKTPPTLTGAPTTSAIYSGWYAGVVTIHWTASDVLSGVDNATVPSDSWVAGEGANLSASATVNDLAGNTGTGNVTGIKIDRTAPTTNAAGLPTGGISKTAVTVTLNATDSGSGVATTYYVLDGGAQQTGTSVTASGDGAHTLEYWSTDNVGNVESPHHTETFVIDGTAPTITHTLSAAANGAGWYNAPVTVTFTCADSGSGVAACTPPQTVSTDGRNQTVTGTATDNAGNTATDSVTLSIDTTKPTLTVTPDRAPTAGGWYNGDVALTFACSDALSSVASCPPPATISGEGVHGNDYTVTDVAENSTTVHSTIRIDLTAPTLSGAATAAPNGAGWYHGDVTIAWTAADALSGIAAAPANSTVTGEGTGFSAGKSVTDIAGNSASATVNGINIDRTAPTTTADAPAGWQAADVTVHFTATDALSGVAVTHYSLDGGPTQDGTAATITTDGVHSLQYWSVDVADNAEAAHTVTVKVDKSSPTISHALSPAPNADGWNKADVTVTFTCADATSGVTGCTTPVVISTETSGQAVTGGAVDTAGNTATDSVTVKLDKTAPTISGAADRAANASGWYNADVTVTFTCADALSGVASCTSPVTLGEGGSQSATGTAADAAGNSAGATVSGINIDETKPTLSGAATATPNANGWYSSDVTIHWTAADTLSGIDPATVPADTTVTGEGDNLSKTASVSDKAGNSQTATVTGIKIDRTAPSTADNAPAGWQKADFTVTLTPADTLSGVANTYYKVDGGAQQSGTAVLISTEGPHTISYWSVDRAGNAETAHSVTVKLDKTTPTIAHTAAPGANGSGWNNADVTVTFACGDALSGVASCTVPAAVTTDGQAQPVTGTAVDNAGNSASDTVTISLDKTAPTISGAADRAANANGWYNADVTVSFTCADPLSGVATCTAPATLGEGGSQSASGTVTDKAGNTASTTVSGINIDKTAPATTDDAPAAWQAADVTVHFMATDALSGVAVTHYSLDSGPTQDGVTATVTTDGVHSLQYWSVDAAGNAETAHTVTLKLDKTSPTISHGLNPAPNADGWNKADVTVTFTCADATSGVASCTAPVVVSAETAGTAVPGGAADTAGNTAADSVTVKLDKTAPAVSGAADRAANANGWYNAGVTVTFTCADALSGVASCTSPVTLGEGGGQSATGTAADVAGNSAGATLSGINIDETKPTLSGAATSLPNANGWYSSDVTIHWTAGDTLSGIDTATVPADATITGEGDSLSTTASVSDKAGNSQTAIVTGIKIDRTAPATGDDAPAAWQKADVTVALTPTDNLSGVANTYYIVDGSAQQSGTAVAVTAEGTHAISYWSVDLAGNSETAHSVTVQLDKTAPTISGATDRAPNTAGWYNADVTVHFTCNDDRSGVVACPADVTLGEGTNQHVDGTVTDNAGNTASVTLSGINIDKTPPALVLMSPGDHTTTGSSRPTFRGTAEPNSTVQVYLDGVVAATLTADVNGAWSYQPATAMADGSHTWQATATDLADNATTSAVRRFSIDTAAPSVTLSSPGNVVTTATPTLSGTASPDSTVSVTVDDTLVGTVTSTGSFSVTVTSPLADGEHTAQAQASDSVGNTATSNVVRFTVKTALPVVRITTPANGQAVTKTISVSGTGTPGATVSVTVGGAPLGSDTVDGAGNWSVSGTVAELAPGPNAVVASITDQSGRSGSPASVLVRYSPKGTLKGTVIDGLTQQPAAGISVSVKDAAGHQVASVSTDTAGAFTVEGIPAGHFTVTAGNASTQVTVPDGKTVSVTLVINAAVQIAVSVSPPSIVGDGRATTTVTAYVTGDDGKPVPNVPVGFTATAGRLSSAAAVTGADGRATVVLTAPSLTAAVPGESVVRAAVKGAEAATVITIAPASIEGTVLGGDGKPVEGARVEVAEDFDGDGTSDFATWMITGPDGKYKLYVPRGNWTYHTRISMPVKIGDHTVTVDTTQTSDVGDVNSVGQGFVANRGIGGQVLVAGAPGSDSATGSLGDGTQIRAAIADANGRTTPLTVASDGTYSMSNLAPGEYHVLFQVVAPNGQKLAGTMSTVTVGQNGVITVDTPLIDPYGIVTDAVTGKPVPGVKMRLMWADTRLNRESGRTPDTEVKLPAIAGFPPNDNADPQGTDAHGAYGWMVFPDADYYLLGAKDGYLVYDSRKEGRNVAPLPDEESYVTAGIVHVGQTIVKYDLKIQPDGTPHPAFIKGYPDGTFQPEAAVTRAEAATMLARALPGGSSAGTATFKDVPATHWAAQSIAFVQAKGLMLGDPDGTFRPDATITRAELAAIVTRIKGIHPVTGTTFADVSGHWAAGVIEAARQAGLVTGFPDGGYHPEDAATRAEFTVMLARTLGRGTHAGAATFSDVPQTYWAAGNIEEAAVDHIMRSLSDGAETW